MLLPPARPPAHTLARKHKDMKTHHAHYEAQGTSRWFTTNATARTTARSAHARDPKHAKKHSARWTRRPLEDAIYDSPASSSVLAAPRAETHAHAHNQPRRTLCLARGYDCHDFERAL